MKKIALCLLASLALWQAAAEEGAWTTDFAKAQSQAKAEKKMVLMDFNGSDWCPPCKALRKTVLNSPEFVEFAKNNLVLVDVDFPHHKKQTEELKKANDELQKKFNVEGYPTVIVLSADGKQLRKMVGYDGQTAKEFIADLEKAKSES
ncbi:MAG TPA: thioredoxin family protein [Verrucomicrobiae bacterium]|nr:thioredoxin family protein [Verrucomicrobiae bacterium]